MYFCLVDLVLAYWLFLTSFDVTAICLRQHLLNRNIKTRNSCTGHSPVQSIGHARSCRHRGVLDRADMAVTKLQISPVIVNGFENGFHQWIQRIFLVVVKAKKKLYSENFFFKFVSTLRPCSD